MFDYDKYGDALASTECPHCHKKPLIVKVWPKTENKYQVRCHNCQDALGKIVDGEWKPIEFDSIEEADREWKRRVEVGDVFCGNRRNRRV